MSKLIMMKGLPRSGKSTWAKDFVVKSGNAVIVSRDVLREMLHNGKWTGRNEKVTMAAQKALVEHLLQTVQTVIVDDTNLGDYHLARWQGVAKEMGATFEVHHESESDLPTLIARDLKSETPRGENVITGMAMANGYVSFAPDSVVLCDLDGTLCDITHRRHLVVDPANRDWNKFFELTPHDSIREITKEMLLKFKEAGKTIIFVSARPEKCRADTEAWLDKHFFYNGNTHSPDMYHPSVTSVPYFTLIMRPDADTRDDTIVKKEILDKYLNLLWIHAVIDDRPKVVRMWKEHGLNVIDVGEGVEF